MNFLEKVGGVTVSELFEHLITEKERTNVTIAGESDEAERKRAIFYLKVLTALQDQIFEIAQEVAKNKSDKVLRSFMGREAIPGD